MIRVQAPPLLRGHPVLAAGGDLVPPWPQAGTLAGTARPYGEAVGDTMIAMVLERIGQPLVARRLPMPTPAPGEALLQIEACGVCRTDLHLVDGELPNIVLPVIPGHECVGRVVALGPGVDTVSLGDRLGVPWLAATCRRCHYCLNGQENLCEQAAFTGYTRPGGYASHMLAEVAYSVPLAADADPVSIAPLLCAGLIGWRALRKTGTATRLGLYGFGASAHLIAQVAHAQQRQVFAFTRPGDQIVQAFARELGCAWVGGSDQMPPEALDAAIVFAPDGSLVPIALCAVRKGGKVVCAGIHMSDIPSFPYRWLWGEREVMSVANLTSEDARSFFGTAACQGLHATTHVYPLSAANQALADLRAGALTGAAVLLPAREPERSVLPSSDAIESTASEGL